MLARPLLVTMLSAGVATTSPALAHGAESGWPIEAHGFLLGTVSGRTTGVRPVGGDGDLVLGEERVRLDLSGAAASGAALGLVKVDLFHDAVDNAADVDLREAYASYTTGPFDFLLGRQIITWGVADLFFISDVFPKDWESFFSGRPMEYLKLGVDGFRARYSSGVINGEAIAAPFSFTSDRLPPADRFIYYDPFASLPTQRKTDPVSRFSNTDLALRLYRQLAGFDLSLHAYRGFWRTPSVRLDDPISPVRATRFFPDLSVYAASAQRNVLGGVVSIEGGYYDSRQDESGTDSTIPNSQWRLLAGYQRELWPDFTAALQAYGELTDDYNAYRRALPAGSPRQDEWRATGSVRLTWLLDYQAWRLSLFAAQSPTDEDYFVQPEVSHKVTDALSLAAGANIFGGRRETTFFGQFEKSDNAFFRVRVDF